MKIKTETLYRDDGQVIKKGSIRSLCGQLKQNTWSGELQVPNLTNY